MTQTAPARPRPKLMIVLALIILVPAMVGFGNKFWEFLILLGDEQDSFTVIPILNYLLVSLGFLFLFGWAVLHGMFRNIEGPKYTMLADQQRLDEEERLEEEYRRLQISDCRFDGAPSSEYWQGDDNE
jgi:hypothetical protein